MTEKIYREARMGVMVFMACFGILRLLENLSQGQDFAPPVVQKIPEAIQPTYMAMMSHHLLDGSVHDYGTVDPQPIRVAFPHASDYADACHLCYEARTTLRARFPELLAPDQMYGVGL